MATGPAATAGVGSATGAATATMVDGSAPARGAQPNGRRQRRRAGSGSVPAASVDEHPTRLEAMATAISSDREIHIVQSG